jgi:hypothetical protein
LHFKKNRVGVEKNTEFKKKKTHTSSLGNEQGEPIEFAKTSEAVTRQLEELHLV